MTVLLSLKSSEIRIKIGFFLYSHDYRCVPRPCDFSSGTIATVFIFLPNQFLGEWPQAPKLRNLRKKKLVHFYRSTRRGMRSVVSELRQMPRSHPTVVGVTLFGDIFCFLAI